MVKRARLRQVIVHNEKCTGCKICETVCTLVNDRECNPAIARLQVSYDQFTGQTQVEIKPSCIFCGECVRWCPTRALTTGYYKREEISSG